MSAYLIDFGFVFVVRLRGAIVSRTCGLHKNLPVYIYVPIFTSNIWSYLLWSPVNSTVCLNERGTGCDVRAHALIVPGMYTRERARGKRMVTLFFLFC